MPDIYLPGMMNTGIHIPQSKVAKGSPKTIHPPGPIAPRGGQAHKVAVKAVKSVPKKGVVPKAATAAPSISTPSYSPTTVTPEDAVLSGQYNLNQNLPLSQALQVAGTKVQGINPTAYANNMANMQYGGQITGLAQRIKGIVNALPGSLDALNKAFANINAQRQVSVVNPQTSGQGVANLFGGNTGAAAVAANQSAQASAQAANQAGSLTDYQQAADRNQADWAQRIQLLNNMAVNQGRSDLLSAQATRDASKKAYYDQGVKLNQDAVTQAIANQGALNNQRIAAALASGQLESLQLGNQGKALQNMITGTNAAAAPALAGLQIDQGKQSILTQIANRNINTATANAQLKQLNQNQGVTTINQAISKGGSDALGAMILPKTATVPTYDSAGNQTGWALRGNPNNYYKQAVAQLAPLFPGSSKQRVKQYVTSYIRQALTASKGNKWVYKSGKWVKG